MVNRALSLATVTLLIGGFAMAPALAQNQNLEAGKSPAQIFAGACNECHKSPRGLLKTVSAGSLPGFLKEHYTTSPDMASLLSAYLISNGATDTRYAAKPGRNEKKDEKPEPPPGLTDQIGRRLRSAMPQEAARPDAEQAAKPDADAAGLSQAEPGRRGHKRLARSSEPPDAARPAADGQVPAQIGGEHGPDGRKSAARQRRGRPAGEETPRIDVRREEPGKGDALKEDGSSKDGSKGDTVKLESGKPEAVKPAAESKSDSAVIEPQKPAGGGETPALRPDPVPPVTPAPPASAAASAAISNGALEPVVEPALVPPPQAVAAPPPSPPVAPAGPPAPPISQ
jgi:hypothetical protein